MLIVAGIVIWLFYKGFVFNFSNFLNYFNF